MSPNAASRLSDANAAAGGPGLTAAAGPSRASRAALLCVVVGLLCLLGLMMVLSASSVEALHFYGGAWLFFQRQLIWVVLGAVAMVLAARFDYRRWQGLVRPAVVVCLVLLALVLIPALGLSVGGSRRWLGFGAARVQPSELAKLALLLFAADLLARRADKVRDPRMVMRPLLVVTGAFGFLVMLEPDMGTGIVLALIALTVLFVGGLPLLRMAGVLVGTAVAGVVVIMVEGYRRARLFSFLDPWKDPGNTGYQVAQSLVALGSGKVTGVGLGASRAKWGFLPNAHTDFIFAIIGEELGLLGTVLTLGLFIAFAVLGVQTAMRAPDRFGALVAAGVTGWVAGQALINMGAVTGRLPVTGVPLPFVSFGGSSLVVTMAAAGILVNIARQGARTQSPPRARTQSPPRALPLSPLHAGTQSASRTPSQSRPRARTQSPPRARTMSPLRTRTRSRLRAETQSRLPRTLSP